MHPVPMDGTDGKVANEPSRVRVSVVEPSGTWTFGLGKNRDVGGGVVMLKLLFLMSNYDPTYVYGVRDNIGTLLATR